MCVCVCVSLPWFARFAVIDTGLMQVNQGTGKGNWMDRWMGGWLHLRFDTLKRRDGQQGLGHAGAKPGQHRLGARNVPGLVGKQILIGVEGEEPHAGLDRVANDGGGAARIPLFSETRPGITDCYSSATRRCRCRWVRVCCICVPGELLAGGQSPIELRSSLCKLCRVRDCCSPASQSVPVPTNMRSSYGYAPISIAPAVAVICTLSVVY